MAAPVMAAPPMAGRAPWRPHDAASRWRPVRRHQGPVRPHDRRNKKVYVGQDELVLGTLVALFSGGHVLIESVPGLGKTLFVRTLAACWAATSAASSSPPTLMPSDITGAPVFDMKTQEFRFRPGPVFTQILLCDEINRSPPRRTPRSWRSCWSTA